MDRPQQRQPTERVPGWGSDADPSRRPGVPMELGPENRPGAHWKSPSRQGPPQVEVLKPPDREELPPVFSTALPPQRLSGTLRRFAYRYPDHLTRRWMILLIADRVDVAENAFKRTVPAAAGVGFALCAVLLLKSFTPRV